MFKEPLLLCCCKMLSLDWQISGKRHAHSKFPPGTLVKHILLCEGPDEHCSAHGQTAHTCCLSMILYTCDSLLHVALHAVQTGMPGSLKADECVLIQNRLPIQHRQSCKRRGIICTATSLMFCGTSACTALPIYMRGSPASWLKAG